MYMRGRGLQEHKLYIYIYYMGFRVYSSEDRDSQKRARI